MSEGHCVTLLSNISLSVWFWKLKTSVKTLLLSDFRVNKARLETQELLENLELG